MGFQKGALCQMKWLLPSVLLAEEVQWFDSLFFLGVPEQPVSSQLDLKGEFRVLKGNKVNNNNNSNNNKK